MRKARVRALKRAFESEFGHTPNRTRRIFEAVLDELTGRETGEQKLRGWLPSERRRIKKLYNARRRRGIPAEPAHRKLAVAA